MANWLYPKLKPGPGRTSDEVLASQRARLRTAMVELCAEHGYEGVKVRALTRLARVSTGTFYQHFTNAEDCFADTYDSLMRATLRRARIAQAESEGWEEGLRAALLSILEDVASHPREAHLVLIDVYALGPAFHPQMNAAIGSFEQLLIESFARAPHEVASPTQIARGMAAGVMRVARTRVSSDTAPELEDVARQVGDWMLCLADLRGVDLGSSPEWTPPPLSGNGRLNDLPRRPVASMRRSVGDERSRILSAVIKLARTGGYSSLTVPRIRAEAGVSRRKFDQRFDGVDDCFLEAVEDLALSVAGHAEHAALQATSLSSAIHHVIGTLCTQMAANPALARLVFVEIFAPGSKGLERRERLLTLATARFSARGPNQPSELLTEASVAAAWQILQSELEGGRSRTLPGFVPSIAQAILTPAPHTHPFLELR